MFIRGRDSGTAAIPVAVVIGIVIVVIEIVAVFVVGIGLVYEQRAGGVLPIINIRHV